MNVTCDVSIVIDFDSVECSLPSGHQGFHECNGEGGRFIWHPKHTGSTGYSSPRETWPDDTEINECIAEADSLADGLFDIASKYDIPVTSNYERWQEGRFLRDIWEFINDVMTLAEKYPVKKLEN